MGDKQFGTIEREFEEAVGCIKRGSIEIREIALGRDRNPLFSFNDAFSLFVPKYFHVNAT